MAVTCEYANPSPDVSRVNYHFDADSMTVLHANDPLVLDFVASGGVIGAYIQPPAPPSVDSIDMGTLNAALTQQGSAFRALALLSFQEINKLRQNAGLSQYTLAQFTAAMKAQMR